jgi:hypothetical protein
MSLATTAGNSRNSGYLRADNDWYVEPSWAVDALLDVERFRGETWDPACGCGTIPEAFKNRLLPCRGSDLVDRGYGAQADFLTGWFPEEVANIVTNPPFNLAEQFAWKALEIADHKVAILQRLAWLESKSRSKLFDETPLARVWIFRRRVSMPPGGTGAIAKGGSIPFAWYVWDKDPRGAPELRWMA